MDDLTKKYIQQGKNDHAMVTMMLEFEMGMADGDFHKAVGALQRKFDDPGLGFNEDRQKKLSDILLNDVSGDAFDVVKPAAAPASKKDALVSKINADPKLKADSEIAKAKATGDIKSQMFWEAAKNRASKK